MAIDVAALALRIEAIGLTQANAALDQLEIRGKKAAKGLTETERASQQASAGTTRLNRTLATAAFQLAGLPGPLGKVAQGFAQFATGGVVTVAVGLGIAGLVALFRGFTSAATESAEAVKLLQQQLDRLGAPAAAGAKVRAGIISTEIEALQAQLADVQRTGLAGGSILGGARKLFESPAAAEARIQEQINQKVIERAKFEREADAFHASALEKAAAKQEKMLKDAEEAVANMAFWAGVLGMPPEQVRGLKVKPNPLASSGISVQGTAIDLRTGMPALAGLKNDPLGLRSVAVTAQGLGNSLENDLGRSVTAMGMTFQDSSEKVQISAALMVAGVSSAVAGLLNALHGGGGFLGVLGSLGLAVGSIVAMIPGLQVPGAIIAGSGVLLNAIGQEVGRETDPTDPTAFGGMIASRHPPPPSYIRTVLGGDRSTNPTAPTPVAAFGPNYFIGANDPNAQREVTAMVRSAIRRGYQL